MCSLRSAVNPRRSVSPAVDRVQAAGNKQERVNALWCIFDFAPINEGRNTSKYLWTLATYCILRG